MSSHSTWTLKISKWPWGKSSEIGDVLVFNVEFLSLRHFSVSLIINSLATSVCHYCTLVHDLLSIAITKPWTFFYHGVTEPRLSQLKVGNFTQLPFLEVLATTSFSSV